MEPAPKYFSRQHKPSSYKYSPFHLQTHADKCNCDDGPYIDIHRAMGVSEASVWDSRGDLQKNTSELREAVATEQRRLSSDAAPKPPLRLCIPGGIQETEPGFRLNILQLSDGRQDITTAAKAYTEAVCNSTANTADLTPDEFSGWLGVASSPDLVLKFGSDDFLHGLLPWQISVSEILKIRTHKHILLRTFLNSFRQFGDCSRRFGK